MKLVIGKSIGITGVLIALIGAFTLKDNILLVGFGLLCIGMVIDSFESLKEEGKE